MSTISFFTPVHFEEKNKTFSQSLLEIADGYFALGEEEAIVLSSEKGHVKIEVSPTSYLKTALKIISYVTLILPLLMLVVKAVMRSQYKFTILDKPTQLDQEGNKEPPVIPLEGKKPFKALQPYLSLAQLGLNFAARNKVRGAMAATLNPLERYIVTPIATFVSDALMGTLNKTIGYLPHDPFSSERLLSIAKKTREKSLAFAQTTPIELPLVDYFHKCAIVVARYLYILSRDVHDALILPEVMRKTTKVVIRAAKEEIVEKMAQDAFAPPQAPVKEEKGFFGKVFSWVKDEFIDIGVQTFSKALDRIEVKALATIGEQEKNLRQKVVGQLIEKGVKWVFAFGVRWGVRTAVVMGGTYVAIQFGENLSLFTQTLPWLTNSVIKVATLALWAQCLIPTMDQLYEEHKKDFDHETTLFTTLNEVVDCKKYLPALSKQIESRFGSSSYVSNFKQRIERELA